MKKIFASILALAGAVACGSSNDGETNRESLSFALDADPIIAQHPGSKVAVFWTVTSGQDDYTYAFGDASRSASAHFVSFSTTPPREALNNGNLGVGVVAVVDGHVSEGRVTKRQIGKVHAVSLQHAIIYRASDNPRREYTTWERQFPQGFACGRCVPKKTRLDDRERFDERNLHDSFEPEACEDIKLEAAESGFHGCDWT